MSPKKDERKNAQEETKLESQASITTKQLPQQEEIRKAVIDAFDEAKNSAQKALEEATKEIPRYTEAVNNYQERIFQDAKEIADNYIDSQIEILNSLQQSQVRNVYQTFWPNRLLSPSKEMTETYANAVSRYIDNAFNATKLANNITIANMESFRTSVQNTKENAKEMSRIATDYAKLFEMATEVYIKPLNWSIGQSSGNDAEITSE